MSVKTTVGMLTFKGHVKKSKLRKVIFSIYPACNDMKIAVAHETADDTDPYEHTHCVIHFGGQTSISKKRFLLMTSIGDGGHCNWKKGYGKTAWNDMLKYISKEDSDVGYVYEPDKHERYLSKVDVVWNCSTAQEVVLAIDDPKEFFQWLAIWNLKDYTKVHLRYHEEIALLELNDDQHIWLDHVMNQGDRKITWVTDYKGGTGKSTFCKWLHIVKGAQMMPMRTKAVNFLYKGAEYVCFDIVRTIDEKTVSYQAIEETKDGYMASDKYEGREMLFKPPKVIVMSNFYPEVYKMTMDRWDIIEVQEKNREIGECTLVPVKGIIDRRPEWTGMDDGGTNVLAPLSKKGIWDKIRKSK